MFSKMFLSFKQIARTITHLTKSNIGVTTEGPFIVSELMRVFKNIAFLIGTDTLICSMFLVDPVAL